VKEEEEEVVVVVEDEEERKVIQSKISEEGKLFGLFSMWLPGLSRQLRARPQEHRCPAKLQSHPTSALRFRGSRCAAIMSPSSKPGSSGV